MQTSGPESYTQETDPLSKGSLQKLQVALLLAYAASLPVSMTLSWGLLIAGLVLLAVQILLSALTQHETSSALRCPFTLPLQCLAGMEIQSLAGAPLIKPLFLFSAAVALSGLVNGGLIEALASLASLKGILCYFWAYSVFAHDRHIVQSCVFVMLAVGAAAGILGTVEQIANFHPLGYRYMQGTGFLGGPMSFAGQMQMLSTLSLALLFIRMDKATDKNKKLSRDSEKIHAQKLPSSIFLICTALGNCLGVIFAAERSSWLGFLAGLAAITIAISWRRFIATMATVWVLAASGWLMLPVFQKRLLPLLSWQHDVSVRVRLFLWQQSLQLWQHNPVFGIGFRKFPHFNIPEAIVPGRSIDINHAHSNYLQILCTTGIAGLAAYLWLWIRMLLTAWENFRHAQSETSGFGFERALALGIFGGTIALLVSGAFEYNFGTAHVRLMQWLLLGMLLPKKDRNVVPLRTRK